MDSVRIILPPRDTGDVSGALRKLTAAICRTHPYLDGGGGLGGENGYGVDFENDLFVMRRFYWGDCKCGADDAETERPHDAQCPVVLPNFHHKASGLVVRWYKWIGRGNEIDGPVDHAPALINECIDSV